MKHGATYTVKAGQLVSSLRVRSGHTKARAAWAEWKELGGEERNRVMWLETIERDGDSSWPGWRCCVVVPM